MIRLRTNIIKFTKGRLYYFLTTSMNFLRYLLIIKVLPIWLHFRFRNYSASSKHVKGTGSVDNFLTELEDAFKNNNKTSPRTKWLTKKKADLAKAAKLKV